MLALTVATSRGAPDFSRQTSLRSVRDVLSRALDPDPANRRRIIDWTRAFWDALHPFALGGAYVNFLMDDEGDDRTRATYGDNYPRLRDVKRAYDPENRFRVNKNIAPGDGQTGAPTGIGPT